MGSATAKMRIDEPRRPVPEDYEPRPLGRGFDDKTQEEISYEPGPTMTAFHSNRHAYFKGVRGPVGSGKTVGCVMDMLLISRYQRPYRGVRRTRWLVVRNTYEQLERTTIQTWKDWVDPTMWPVRGSHPKFCHVKQMLPDGTLMDMQVYFLALDREEHVKKVLSFEITGVYFNEASEIPFPIVKAALKRCGRYPRVTQGGTNWRGGIADTNPPNNLNWWYRMAEVVRPQSWTFYSQPGALIRLPNGKYDDNPKAENIKYSDQGYDYYYRQIDGASQDFINRYILNLYGNIFSGKPVYKDEYDDNRHVSKRPLGIYRNLPLILGWDFGLNPALIIGQVAPSGRLNLLREYCGVDIGLEQFLRRTVLPALAREFPRMKLISVGDPAGKQRSQNDEVTPFQTLKKHNLPTFKAPTNAFDPRRSAVVYFLRQSIGAGPAMLIDPSMTTIREGFQGGYKYAKIQTTGELEKYREEPEKNLFSHPHDGLQYLCLEARFPSSPSDDDTYTPQESTWGHFAA